MDLLLCGTCWFGGIDDFVESPLDCNGGFGLGLGRLNFIQIDDMKAQLFEQYNTYYSVANCPSSYEDWTRV